MWQSNPRWEGEGEGDSYSRSGGLNISVIHCLRGLANRRRKPPESLRDRRHRILLPVVESQSAIAPSAWRRRRAAPESAILAALAGGQIVTPRGVISAQAREVLVVDLDAVSLPHRGFSPPREWRAAPRVGGRRDARCGALLFLLPLSHYEFFAVHLTAQALLILLPDEAGIPPRNRLLLPGYRLLVGARVLSPEPLPPGIAAQAHPFGLGGLEGVHGHAPDEGDVHAQGAVAAGALEADEDAELRRGPLWGGGTAVAAVVVARLLLQGHELMAKFLSADPLAHFDPRN